MGKRKTQADPVLTEKLKEMKRLSHTYKFTNRMNTHINSPLRKAGTSKFWIPASTSKRLFGIRLQNGTPSKVPKELVTVQNPSNFQATGSFAKPKVARALARLF